SSPHRVAFLLSRFHVSIFVLDSKRRSVQSYGSGRLPSLNIPAGGYLDIRDLAALPAFISLTDLTYLRNIVDDFSNKERKILDWIYRQTQAVHFMGRGKKARAKRPFTQVNVFSADPLGGNPLAVVHAAEGLSEAQMAALARWTNLSETTFLLPPTDSGADYCVRIFTPGGELPFAGHPTL